MPRIVLNDPDSTRLMRQPQANAAVPGSAGYFEPDGPADGRAHVLAGDPNRGRDAAATGRQLAAERGQPGPHRAIGPGTARKRPAGQQTPAPGCLSEPDRARAHDG